jgi:hypothetical protein
VRTADPSKAPSTGPATAHPADAVLSYHLSRLGCGVARFNRALAEQLGVPLLHVFDPAVTRLRRPLLSIKPEEIGRSDRLRLSRWLRDLPEDGSLRLFLHGYAGTPFERTLVRRAECVWTGNGEIAARLRPLRVDPVEVWCPSALPPALPDLDPEISVFSFGMAHKVRGAHYERLRALLEATGRSYALFLSTALHEGYGLEESFSATYDEIASIFGARVQFLGFLSDSALREQMKRATFVAAFFEDGVRANNTSVHAAMDCGAVVITNLDEGSPAGFAHDATVLDIARCDALPLEAETLDRIRCAAQETAARYGWDALLEKLGASAPQASAPEAPAAEPGRPRSFAHHG